MPQQLTSHDVSTKEHYGPIFEETPDSTFVFQCVGTDILYPCKQQINIHHTEVDTHMDYKCPNCWHEYKMDEECSPRKLYSEITDFDNDHPEDEDELKDEIPCNKCGEPLGILAGSEKREACDCEDTHSEEPDTTYYSDRQ